MLSAWQNPGLCTYLQVDHRENGWCNHPPFSKAYSGRGSYIHTHAFLIFLFLFQWQPARGPIDVLQRSPTCSACISCSPRRSAVHPAAALMRSICRSRCAL